MPQSISQSTAQQIVDTVKDVCGMDINYINPDGYIYASTQEKRIGEYHEIGKQCILKKETIEVEEDAQFYGTKAGVNIPILYQGEPIGVIGISGAPSQVRRFAYLAERITLLLLREQELESENASHKNRISFIVQSLLSKKQSENQTVKQYFAERHIKEDSIYRILVLKLNQRYHPTNISLIEHSIFQTFQRTASELYTFHHPNEYILILKEEQWKRYRDIFLDFSEKESPMLRMAVGGKHPLSELYLSYSEAKLALKSLREGNFLEYASLGIELLLPSIPEEDSAFFRRKFLEKLNEEEIALLKTYYQMELSLQKTADALFLHKNTIQYKLDRIKDKTGFHPRKFTDATGFYAALLL